jgi:hypothetical protein
MNQELSKTNTIVGNLFCLNIRITRNTKMKLSQNVLFFAIVISGSYNFTIHATIVIGKIYAIKTIELLTRSYPSSHFKVGRQYSIKNKSHICVCNRLEWNYTFKLRPMYVTRTMISKRYFKAKIKKPVFVIVRLAIKKQTILFKENG